MTEPRREISGRSGPFLTFWNSMILTIALLLLTTVVLLLVKGLALIIIGWILLIAAFVLIGAMLRQALSGSDKTGPRS